MIDRSSPIPFYVQLKDAILGRIDRSEWKAGDQLPSEPELCVQYGVSRTVVRQALQDLEFEGKIRREKGRGTFVAAAKITESLAQDLTGFFQDMADKGREAVSKVLRLEILAAQGKVASQLALAAGQSVIAIERLRYVEDLPLVLVTTFLPYERCRGLENEDLRNQSLYAVLQHKFGLTIASGRRTMEAVGANQREADLLQVSVGTPLMLLDSVGYLEDGTPIEMFHALHRGDRSRFEVELIRKRPMP